jgi:hypothetical protein
MFSETGNRVALRAPASTREVGVVRGGFLVGGRRLRSTFGVVVAIGLALSVSAAPRLAALERDGTLILSVTSRFSREDGDAEGDNHRYTVSVARGSVVTVLLRSSEVDSYLTVHLPGGRRIVNDDFDGLDAGIVETVFEDGVVEIVASPIVSLQEGRYQLTVHVRAPDGPSAPGGPPEGGSRSDPIRRDGDDVPVREDRREPLLVHLGRLQWGDSRGYDGKFVDTVPYQAAEGETVVVDLVSDDFDALLFVASPEGIILGDDDDSGEGSNARVTVTFPEDGLYEIRATSYAEATGDYVLTVSR